MLYLIILVRVAQWIEQQPSKLWVAGSIPAADAIITINILQLTVNKIIMVAIVQR